MKTYLLKRLIQTPVVLLTLITVSFFIMRFAPGGPFSDEKAVEPAVREALEAKYDLDKPLVVQYLLYLGNLARGDLGISMKHKATTVREIMANTLPASILIGFLAVQMALVIGIAAGCLAALRHNSFTDVGAMSGAVLGISIPTFVIGPLLQVAFAMKLGWLPVAGYSGLSGPLYLILPSVTLALPFAARIARLTRAGMLDVLNQDFIRTARAKGLSEWTIVFQHALRGGILPVISFLGPAIASIMTGSLVVEQIFQIPGLGREFIEAALNRDYTLVLGTVIVYGTALILFNLAADVFYAILDPRVSYQ